MVSVADESCCGGCSGVHGALICFVHIQRASGRMMDAGCWMLDDELRHDYHFNCGARPKVRPNALHGSLLSTYRTPPVAHAAANFAATLVSRSPTIAEPWKAFSCTHGQYFQQPAPIYTSQSPRSANDECFDTPPPTDGGRHRHSNSAKYEICRSPPAPQKGEKGKMTSPPRVAAT